MPTGLTPLDIVNRAIDLIGNNQAPVTGTYPNFDTSTAGIAAKILYPGVVQTIMRQFAWDFGRSKPTVLVVTGNTPPPQWAFEYTYPADGLEIRQVMPTTIVDANDPVPVNWTVGNVLVTSTPTKVIWTNQASALCVYSNQPPPSIWDAGFTEAVVRLLASEMAMAIPGRPDVSQKMLESAQGFEALAEGIDG